MRGMARREATEELAPFGERLRAAIKKSRFRTRAEFLRHVGVEGATMHRYEKGSRQPPLSQVRKWATELGTTVEFLATGTTLAADAPDRISTAGKVSRGWEKFVRLGLIEHYKARGLSDEQIDWLQRAPARDGQVSKVDFYTELADDLLGGFDPLESFEEAVAGDEGPDASDLTRPRK